MKTFFTAGSDKGAETNSQTQTPETEKTTEQILINELKINREYAKAYESFLAQGGKFQELKSTLQSIRDGKVEGLTINSNGNFETQDGETKIVISPQQIDFKSFVKDIKSYIEDTEVAFLEKEIKLAFMSNDFDNAYKYLNVNRKSENVKIFNVIHAQVGEKLKEKMPNLKDGQNLNTINWIFTLFIADSMRRGSTKLKKDQSGKINIDSNQLTENMTDVIEKLNKGFGDNTINSNSLILNNPLLAAKILTDGGNILDGKLTLKQQDFEKLIKPESEIENVGEDFRSLQSKFKSAIELKTSDQSITKSITGIFSGFSKAKNDYWNSPEGKALKDNPDFQNMIKFLTGDGNGILAWVFKFLGVIPDGKESTESNDLAQNFSNNILTFVKSLSKKDELKKDNSDKLGQILGIDEKTDLSNLKLYQNAGKDIFLSQDATNILKKYYPEFSKPEKLNEIIKSFLSDSTNLKTKVNGKDLKFNDFFAKLSMSKFDDNIGVDKIEPKKGLIEIDSNGNAALHLGKLESAIVLFDKISIEASKTGNSSKSLQDIYKLIIPTQANSQSSSSTQNGSNTNQTPTTNQSTTTST